MNDQKLKKLSRAELLEMLIEQSELCDELQKRLEQAQNALRSRKLAFEHAGTMAEAAMRLSGVFEAADQAAALYLENVRRMERELEAIRAERLAAVEQEAAQILADAERQREAILKASRSIPAQREAAHLPEDPPDLFRIKLGDEEET